MSTIQLLWLKACLTRKFFSLIASLPSSLQLKMWFMDKQHGHHLGACQKCRLSGPTPHLWNQRPHLTRPPGNLYEHKSLKSPDPIDLTNSNDTGNEDTSVLIVTWLSPWQPTKKLAEYLPYYPPGVKYCKYRIAYGMISSSGNENVAILWFWVNSIFSWATLNPLTILKWLIYGG